MTSSAPDRRLLKVGLSILSGTLLFLSCATFDIWPLTWFAVVPLLWVAMADDTRHPFAYGLLCGLTANAGGFYWIVGFLGRFGHIPLVAAIPIFLLLVTYQGITFALFAWIVRRLGRGPGGDRPLTFLAPIVYVACELVVPYVFPWYLAITQAWVRPVIQIADLTGPLGVSFLLILSNGALYDLWAAMRAQLPLPRRRVAAAALVIVGCLGYGQVRIHQVERRRAAAPKIRIGVVQANIGINEKWQPSLAADQLTIHQTLSAELAKRGAQLILWPESSYPYLFRHDQAHDWPPDDPRQVQRGFSTPLIFGSLTVGSGPYPYNTALFLDGDGNIRGHFDKNILMVFGEYIPYYEHLKLIHEYIPATSNLARGTEVAVFPFELPSGATAKIGPMICYEDIFPSFGRRLAKLHPNLLVNITNDAWFGHTSEPYEHLALSVYRAVEMRLDLVRAVNTGVSAFVDSTGRVYDSTGSVDPDRTPGAPPATLLDEAAVQKVDTLYSNLGEWFGGLCLLFVCGLALVERARAGRPVGWPLVGAGVATLAIFVVVGASLLIGPSRLGLALCLLSHRTPPPGIAEATSFRVGLTLVPLVALGSLLTGAVIAWLGRRRALLEAALAVIAVVVGPALAVGTLEGGQVGLILSAAAAVGLSCLAAQVFGRHDLS